MAIASTYYRAQEAAGTIAALADADGCARHPVVQRLVAPGAAGRDIADAVHALCAVHGRPTSLFDDATRNASFGPGADWFAAAAQAFGEERAYLARLTASVGPLPSTPGQAESDAAFAAQRHAFDMLARSDRTGCAIGAAFAVAIDWRAFRLILDRAAHRAGIAVPPCHLPAFDTFAHAPDAPPAMHRAMAFGAQQTFAQNRGLCDLVEARMIARDQS